MKTQPFHSFFNRSLLACELVICATIPPSLHLTHAGVIPPPLSIAHEMLSESVPLAFPPADFTTDDFQVEWIGKPLEGVQIELEKRSLDWVRTSEAIVLPRGRIHVSAPGAQGGRITYLGYSEALKADGSVETAIALMSGPELPIEIILLKNGRELQGRAMVRFKPRGVSNKPRIFFDNSCSRFDPEVEMPHGITTNDWIFVGCRHIQQVAQHYRTSTLEMYVYWDNVGQSIKIGGVQTPALSHSLWPIRVSAQPGFVDLESQGHPLRIKYKIPHYLYHGRFSLGLGPYSMDFDDGQEFHENNISVMPTLYTSFFFNETMRIVSFGAVNINHHWVTDFGLYFSTQSMHVLDRRFIMNLLLGGHAIGFKSGENYYVKFGGPQGFEAIFTDFLVPGNNITAGGFFYPLIDQKSYINAWLRWGSSKMFYEINYISWAEAVGNTPVTSKSWGITVGFPVPFLSFL